MSKYQLHPPTGWERNWLARLAPVLNFKMKIICTIGRKYSERFFVELSLSSHWQAQSNYSQKTSTKSNAVERCHFRQYYNNGTIYSQKRAWSFYSLFVICEKLFERTTVRCHFCAVSVLGFLYLKMYNNHCNACRHSSSNSNFRDRDNDSNSNDSSDFEFAYEEIK